MASIQAIAVAAILAAFASGCMGSNAPSSSGRGGGRTASGSSDSGGGSNSSSSGSGSSILTDGPVLNSVFVLDGRSVEVTFDKTVIGASAQPANFTVSGSGQGSLAGNPNTVTKLESAKFRLSWSSGKMLAGGDISISASGVEDAQGNSKESISTHTAGAIATPANVTGLADDPTPKPSKTWTWSCDDAPCTYRFAIDTSSTWTETGAFSSTATATQNSGGGTQYLHVQAKDAAGNLSTVTTVSASIGTPVASLQLVSVPASATAGNSFTFTVNALDSVNNVITDYAGTLTFTSNDPGAPVLPSDYAFTRSDSGSKQFSFTLKTGGSRTITVTDSSAGVSATTSAISVGAGSLAQLEYVQQPSNAYQNAAIAPSITVRTKDSYGNLITSATSVTLSIPAGSNPGSGTPSGTLTRTTSTGIATFDDISIDNAGTGYKLRATSGSVTADSSSFNVLANAAPVATSATARGYSNVAVKITLSATDADSDSLTYSIVSGASHGTTSVSGNVVTYTASSGYSGADSFTFRATDGKVNSNTATISITDRICEVYFLRTTGNNATAAANNFNKPYLTANAVVAAIAASGSNYCVDVGTGSFGNAAVSYFNFLGIWLGNGYGQSVIGNIDLTGPAGAAGPDGADDTWDNGSSSWIYGSNGGDANSGSVAGNIDLASDGTVEFGHIFSTGANGGMGGRGGFDSSTGGNYMGGNGGSGGSAGAVHLHNLRAGTIYAQGGIGGDGGYGGNGSASYGGSGGSGGDVILDGALVQDVYLEGGTGGNYGTDGIGTNGSPGTGGNGGNITIMNGGSYSGSASCTAGPDGSGSGFSASPGNC